MMPQVGRYGHYSHPNNPVVPIEYSGMVVMKMVTEYIRVYISYVVVHNKNTSRQN